MASGFPLRAANITVVSPFGPRALASAPALINRSIIFGLPYREAMNSGVLPFAVHCRDVGAGLEQQIGGFQIVAVDRPVQRRGSIHLRGVDIGLRRQQLAEGRGVALHDCVGHIAAGAHHERRRPDNEQRHTARQESSIHLVPFVYLTNVVAGLRRPPLVLLL